MKRLYLGHRVPNIPWWWIFAAFWFGFAFQPHQWERIYDEHFDDNVWFHANLALIPQTEGPPDIDYQYFATRFMSGVWTAHIELEPRTDGGPPRRLNSRKGRGDYSPLRSGGDPWTWHAFFSGDHLDRRPPPEPNVPYRVCANYDLGTTSGVARSYGPFCTEFYDPKA